MILSENEQMNRWSANYCFGGIAPVHRQFICAVMEAVSTTQAGLQFSLSSTVMSNHQVPEFSLQKAPCVVHRAFVDAIAFLGNYKGFGEAKCIPFCSTSESGWWGRLSRFFLNYDFWSRGDFESRRNWGSDCGEIWGHKRDFGSHDKGDYDSCKKE